jgi:tetraacyldisaccharide 4'-kinase
MDQSANEFVTGVLSGSDTSLRARTLRRALRAAEPIYSAVMAARNLAFDHAILPAATLSRPTVSVGNITAGGTGKTPTVRWLAERLRQSGRRPAVLLRGYRANAKGFSDEQRLLHQSLNAPGGPVTPVIANKNRRAGAQEALLHNRQVDTFVLDDAFQHRWVMRNFDLVLINAVEPFGFNHVLPRGLMRESPVGLKRADAFIITHRNHVDETTLGHIAQELRRYNPAAPIFQSDHVQTGLREGDSGDLIPLSTLADRKYFVVCGIADPATFTSQIRQQGGTLAGQLWFEDHHQYTYGDLKRIELLARSSGAQCILTTQKDWVKIAGVPGSDHPALPIYIVGLQICIAEEDELFNLILQKITGNVGAKKGCTVEG